MSKSRPGAPGQQLEEPRLGGRTRSRRKGRRTSTVDRYPALASGQRFAAWTLLVAMRSTVTSRSLTDPATRDTDCSSLKRLWLMMFFVAARRGGGGFRMAARRAPWPEPTAPAAKTGRLQPGLWQGVRIRPGRRAAAWSAESVTTRAGPTVLLVALLLPGPPVKRAAPLARRRPRTRRPHTAVAPSPGRSPPVRSTPRADHGPGRPPSSPSLLPLRPRLVARARAPLKATRSRCSRRRRKRRSRSRRPRRGRRGRVDEPPQHRCGQHWQPGGHRLPGAPGRLAERGRRPVQARRRAARQAPPPLRPGRATGAGPAVHRRAAGGPDERRPGEQDAGGRRAPGAR
jgi:hypothetical protein